MDEMAWWRRPAVLGAAAAAIVVLAVAAIALGSDDSEPSSLAVRAGTTTSTAPDETTTTSAEETTTTTAQTETTTSTTRRTATTTATTRVPATTPPTTTRTSLTEPPAATMRSSDGEVAGERGTYCWQRDGQSLCADSSDIDPQQTLRVRQGSTVDIRWAIEEQPSQVQGKYTEGSQWVDFNPPLPRSNPTQFAANLSPGVHTVAVFSVWSRGDVVHYFKIDVYQ